MVDGLKDWRADHHWTATAVQAATQAYRQEEDGLNAFFGDCCESGQRYSVSAADIYGAYTDWCTEAEEDALTKNTFGRSLSERGFTKERRGHEKAWVWCGLRLRPNAATRSVSSHE